MNEKLNQIIQKLDKSIIDLHQTRRFAKSTRVYPVLNLCRRIMALPEGNRLIYERIQSIEEAGIFAGTDWEFPERLQSTITASTIKNGDASLVILEALNQLRFAAVANDAYRHPRLSSERASHFLSQSMALNLSLVFGQLGEAERIQLGSNADALINNFAFVVEQIGLGNIIEKLIEEIWRLLLQRPVQVEPVKQMVTQLSVYLYETESALGNSQNRGAERLISALYGPTRGCQEDPGLDVYRERLSSMDDMALRNEALGFSRAMHDTGLVSPYHAVFLRYIHHKHNEIVAICLGLSSTGIDSMASYSTLVQHLIEETVYPETSQVVLGLCGLLERGILYSNPVALGLWRQLYLPISAESKRKLESTGNANISPRVKLLSGVVQLLGQPLGLGQGNNPLCQSVRALTMWAENDPNYLLKLISCAARDNNIQMYFEGGRLSSEEIMAYNGHNKPLKDLDPVSAVVVPHLDAIYHRMGQLCADRGEDIHKWVNPELHGWWVGRDFSIAVDINSGMLIDYEVFIRRFYACYHPLYNGNTPVVNLQPAGIASTDSLSRFLGWHAISILRVGFDPESVTRVYFYNPNNDSGQNWGSGIQVSTEGHGERFGESSLTFEEFTSHLYIFHYEISEQRSLESVHAEKVEKVKELAFESWAGSRI